MYTFDGVLSQNWTLADNICYAKAHSGAAGRESILLGLAGGAVVHVLPGLQAQVHALLSHGASIRCCSHILHSHQVVVRHRSAVRAWNRNDAGPCRAIAVRTDAHPPGFPACPPIASAVMAFDQLYSDLIWLSSSGEQVSGPECYRSCHCSRRFFSDHVRL